MYRYIQCSDQSGMAFYVYVPSIYNDNEVDILDSRESGIKE